MLANISNAAYNPTTGTIQITLPNSTINGYLNQVQQYQSPNTLSVPIPGMLVDLDVQAPTQMQVTGYNNSIIDTNYTIAQGEFTSYSRSWYGSTRNSGVEIQEAQTPNKENMMMGQSTNSVLLDIMNLLVNIISYLGTHTHSAGSYATNVPVTGISGTPTQTVPDDGTVVQDQSYIQANKNLAITGVYKKYPG